MRVLFDQGTPAPLSKYLPGHQVATAFELGWGSLKNGELLKQAEDAGFTVLITTDQNLRYQQNLTGRRIAVLVLNTTSWPRIEKCTGAICDAVVSATPGGYFEVAIT